MESDGVKFKKIKTYVKENLTPIRREVLQECFRQAWNEDIVRSTSPDLWVIAVLAFLGTGAGAELREIAKNYLYERSEYES